MHSKNKWTHQHKKTKKKSQWISSLRVLQFHCKEGKRQVLLVELTTQVEKNKNKHDASKKQRKK